MKHKNYGSAGELSEPLDYTRIIFEQVRSIAKLRIENKQRYFSAVMELKNLLTPYIFSDKKIKIASRIERIIFKRDNEFKKCLKRDRDNEDFLTDWNVGTSELIFRELMLLMSRCGFLPERNIEYVIGEDD